MNSFIKKAFSVLLIGCLLVLGLGVVRVNADTVSTGDMYKLVKNTNDLEDGDLVIIVAGGSGAYYGLAGQNSNNRSAYAFDATLDSENNIFTFNEDNSCTVVSLTLGITELNEETVYTFNDGEGYLYAASSSSNYLRTKTELDDNGKFELVIDSNGAVTATAQGSNTRNMLRYNSNNKIFSCYASGQQAIYIYKKIDSSQSETVEEVFENSTSVKNKLIVDYTKSIVQAEQFSVYSGEITEGDYIIYYDGKAMKNAVSNNRLSYEAITPVNNTISLSQASDDIVWHIAPSGDYWTIYNETVDKYAASTGTKNQAGLQTDIDDKSLWTVSGDDTYEFVNKNNSSSSVNANLRNNGTYGFACYSTSTGGALTLYKKGVSNSTTYELDKDNENHLKVQLLFGQMIEKELYDDLIAEDASAKFGMLYITSENKGSKTFGELLEESNANLRNVVCIPVRVDNSGELSDSGTKMQYGVAISSKRFSNDVTKDICCVAYTYLNGNYYFSSEKVASVKSVAGAYVSEHLSNDEVQAHLGVLTWLSTYND